MLAVKCIFLKGSVCISIKISQNFFLVGAIELDKKQVVLIYVDVNSIGIRDCFLFWTSKWSTNNANAYGCYVSCPALTRVFECFMGLGLI